MLIELYFLFLASKKIMEDAQRCGHNDNTLEDTRSTASNSLNDVQKSMTDAERQDLLLAAHERDQSTAALGNTWWQWVSFFE